MSYFLLGVLELVVLARYPADVRWSSPSAWVYAGFLLTVIPVGLLGWRMAIRAGPAAGT
ncbi:MAG: hypothetical protein ACRDJ4_06360 [Actinomycetota bacterium]